MSRRSSTGSSVRRNAGPAPGARVLHLDAFSGAAGNMFLGALLELGLPRRALEADLRGLGVPFRLKVESVRRGALGATHLDVVVPGAPKPARKAKRTATRARDHDHDHDDEHDRAHAHGHAHDHGPEHAHAAGAAHAHAAGRPYVEIRRTIERSKLVSSVRDCALAIFEALAKAEAHVHRMPVEKVHFHEVGAVDALVDVTGAAIGLHRLGVSRVTCSPVAVGHGHVHTAHGVLPLPAPAALELLRGVPVVPAHVAWETVTPTGAAILRTIVDEYRPLPAMIVEAVGHGAGSDRPGPMPNVLRAVLGRAQGATADRVTVLEANLDDFVPEHFEHVMGRLLEAGALDVTLQHVQMKKSRPGFALRVIARPSERLVLAQILFAESTTLGVRVSEHDRLVLEREERRVATAYGRIGVKIVWGPDGRPQVSAEYEDCARAARARGAALRDVVRAAEDAARQEVSRHGR